MKELLWPIVEKNPRIIWSCLIIVGKLFFVYPGQIETHQKKRRVILIISSWQINKMTPSNAPLSFGTQSMLPIGILQPTSSNFPVQAQPANPANPAHPPNPVRGGSGSQRSHRSSRLHSGSRGLPADPFGAAPFLPPPPGSKSSRYQHHQDSQNIYGTLGHQRPGNFTLSSNEQHQLQLQQKHHSQFLLQQQQQQQEQQQQHQPITIPTLKPVPQPPETSVTTSAAAQSSSNDRYAIFDSIGSNFAKTETSVEGTSGGFENNFLTSTTTMNSTSKFHFIFKLNEKGFSN